MLITDSEIIDIASASDIGKVFSSFCSHVFAHREVINKSKTLPSKNAESVPSISYELDFQSIHKSLSMFIKIALDNEKNSLSHTNTKDVIYAMTAIADEVFLNIEWEGKQFWEDNILEMKFFATQFAGDEVFNKINELLSKNDHLLVEKAEVYLKMLALGFKGKYRGSEDEQTEIDAYRRRLFDFITKSDKTTAIASAEYRLFQKEYTYTIPSAHRKLLPDGSVITYASAFFLFIFLTISSFIWIFETRDFRRLLFEISCIALRE